MPVSTRKCAAFLPAALRCLRIGAYTLLGIAGLLLALLLVHQALCPVIAWILPFSRSFFYDIAVFGAYPITRYVSFDLPAPHGSFARWSDQCDDGFIFLATDGTSVTNQGPVILDGRGDLVWMSDDYDVAMNFRVQHFQGEDYLTFWAGHKDGTLGQGKGVMLDSNYNVFREIQAVGDGLRADLHELQFTDQGSVLITIYNITNLDLRPMGWGRPKDGWVEDCLFQEIDIATGDLLFQWRAQDWFKPEDTYYWHPFGGYDKAMPFDYYHINSIQKDSSGNYLISSRHFHHVVYINGTSGEPIWILGGHAEKNDFTDLSDGVATGFQWQHHARWLNEKENIITLFDNGNAGPLHVDAPYSKGLMIQLDTNQSTATVLQEYVSMGKAKAASMGSVAQLPNGHMLIGWGSSAAYTEHTLDGTLLCEWHFAASMSFWFERAKNYRIFKSHSWVGRPQWPPATAIQRGRLYVSWNGATEVKYWELQGMPRLSEDNKDNRDFTPLEIIDKALFEESFAISRSDWELVEFRVAALDDKKKVLHYSDPIPAVEEQSTSLFAMAVGVTMGIFAALAGVYLFRTWFQRRRRRRQQQLQDRSDNTNSAASLYSWDWDPKVAAIFGGRGETRYSKL